MGKIFSAALLAFACLALLLLSGCPQPPPPESGKYFEIVFQDPPCAGGQCFHEMIVTGDGFVFIKQMEIGQDYNVSFCSADAEKMKALFAFLDGNLKESRLVECSEPGCASYHLFYNSGKQTFHSSVPVGQQTIEKEFYGNASEICASKMEAELIHVIYGKKFEYVDYHIFSNNKSVFERFGLKDGELLESKVSDITAEKFSALKSAVPQEFFSSSTSGNCPANGYFYGYAEAFLGGKYNYAFTCGDESAAGRAFTNVLMEISK